MTRMISERKTQRDGEMLREGLQRDSESQPGLCQCASPAPVVSQRTPFHFPSHRREPGERLWTQRKNNQNDGFGQRLSFRDRERKIMVPTQSFPQSWFGQRLSYRDREREREIMVPTQSFPQSWFGQRPS